MEQPVSAAWKRGSFGAILRAYRHGACLSQEQLAAHAGLSERTVRNLEADRVQSPRTVTVRLLADALELSQLERKRWFGAARAVSHQRAGPAITGADGQVGSPNDARAALSLSARDLGSENENRPEGSPTGKFQAEIHGLYPRGDRSTGQVAKDVDVTETVANASAKQGGRDIGTRPDGGLTGADRWELAELRRENRRLREDMEILRRAAAIFAAATR